MSANKWRCPWCGKYYKSPRPSGWQQRAIGSGEWKVMCNRCATRRLNNPYNAFLGMRRVEADALKGGDDEAR